MVATLNLYDLSRRQLANLFQNWGFSEYHVDRFWEALYRDFHLTLDELDDIRSDLRALLITKANLNWPSLQATAKSQSDSTEKYLLKLADSQMIECVLMRYPGRATACVSTQVGCAIGCVFCATGQMGFIRHLSPGEIVIQILYIMRVLQESGESLRNVVFMGMGEPLHNFKSTMTAIDIITDDKGLAIAPRRITLSTVGLPLSIRRLADDLRPINLAVSLHAASDVERSALVPINKRWPLKEVLDACRYYTQRSGRRIFFEWALIDGENDSIESAQLLAKLVGGMDAHVNLIPLNPTSNFSGKPSDWVTVKAFQATLADFGIPSTVRQRRGIDIDAGCGQLHRCVSSKLSSQAAASIP